MKEINALEGLDSTAEKLDMLNALFLRTRSDDELRYLVRSFSNTGLRIGLSSKSVENCIIQYFEEESKRKDATSISERLADFESQIFGYRIQKLHTSPHTAIYNVPVKSMLGRAAKDPSEVLKMLGLSKSFKKDKVSADFKYDGERT